MAAGGVIAVSDQKLQELRYVEDDGKFYKVTFQLGANRTWRHYTSGRWMRDTSRELHEALPDGTKAYRHVAKQHVTDAVPASTLNGLIGEHNEWLRANRANDRVKGDVGKMLLVTRWDEVQPPKLKSNLPAGFEEMMRGIVAESTAAAVQAAISAMASAGLINAKGVKAASGEKGVSAGNEKADLLGDSK